MVIEETGHGLEQAAIEDRWTLFSALRIAASVVGRPGDFPWVRVRVTPLTNRAIHAIQAGSVIARSPYHGLHRVGLPTV